MDEVYKKLKTYNCRERVPVSDYFYNMQQNLAGMFLDEFALPSKSEQHLVKLRWPIRTACGYYVSDTPIVDQLIKRGYGVRYVPSWNHIFVKIKYKDNLLRKHLRSGKYDNFTNECIKHFSEEDDFVWLKNYARPGFDLSGGLDLDQPAESCNL